jgi:regulator of replication initiation timing
MDAIERKVASLTALNGVLRGENEELRQRLAELEESKEDEGSDVADLQAEFAKRIGQADKQLAELRVSFLVSSCSSTCVLGVRQMLYQGENEQLREWLTEFPGIREDEGSADVDPQAEFAHR